MRRRSYAQPVPLSGVGPLARPLWALVVALIASAPACAGSAPGSNAPSEAGALASAEPLASSSTRAAAPPLPTKTKQRTSSPLGTAAAYSTSQVTSHTETSATDAPDVAPSPTAASLPEEFYGVQAAQLHTAFFCLERAPNDTSSQCHEDLMRCAEERRALGFQKLCEAVREVDCFYAIGDMWVMPYCYRTHEACQRTRQGLAGSFEKTPCAHSVRSIGATDAREGSP